MAMRVVVTGSAPRSGEPDLTPEQQDYIKSVLDKGGITELAQGGAHGVDAVAKAWAELHGVPCTTFEADWRTYGRSAGPMRNARMLYTFLPDIVLAFTTKPLSLSRGTAHCVSTAQGIDLVVHHFRLDTFTQEF